tara:strand:+ start:203 stop:442 length:240 start_codon:yes stop_codon:yes gene_type:complete
VLKEEILKNIIDSLGSRDEDLIVRAEVDGNRANIEVLSTVFEGMRPVGRHQAVYACIAHLIADGRIHAVNIRASLPGEE